MSDHSASEWLWQDGTHNYAVRVFPATHRLIWSSWTETSAGPIFNGGIGQTFNDFLRGDPLPHVPPQPILDNLRAAITLTDEKKPRGLFGWLPKR